MVSTHETWIRIFDIPEISEHKNGFTIYKVVSMLYKESCPDAVTKVTVWKRFNDFKKLHRDLRGVHKKLKSKYPNLPSKTLFKRFDAETIQARKESILNFLDFIGNSQHLFTSTDFVKFLETSHTPRDQLNSNINLIRADLNLPEDPEVCVSITTNSDDERTFSDSDSIGSNLALSSQNDLFSDTQTKLKASTTSINSQSSSKLSDSLSITTNLDSITLIDGQIYLTPPDTPGYTSMDNQAMQYIIDASLHINMAVELENNKKYEEAFTAYKTAVDILLKYGKDDPDYDRRQMVRYKTEKYLIRAEKIYNMYLAPEVKNLQLMAEEEEKQTVAKRPLFDLYKFKVVKIIASGMLALHSELQQLFFIKVVHKNTQFLNENLILPENVPYMVKLHSHYNCENALFLVLEYCSGTRLSDFLKTHSLNSDDVFLKNDTKLFQQHLQDISDNESEKSFSDLINEYNTNRYKKSTDNKTDVKNDQNSTSDEDSFEKIDMIDVLSPNIKKTLNLMDEPLKPCSTKDLMTEFQQQNRTDEDIAKQKYTKKKLKEIDKPVLRRSESIRTERSLSQVSSLDLDDFDSRLVLPQDVIIKWAVQLLIALEKLHTLGIICRDLQTKNILIDENGDLVLTYMCNVKDFGDIFCDGINYNLAPEVYSFHDVTSAVDWWSYGAILYEMLVGVPLSEVHPNGITNFSFLKIPKYVSPEGRSILKQLLNYEPHDRLGSGINGIENIKSHPFFHLVSWDSFMTFR